MDLGELICEDMDWTTWSLNRFQWWAFLNMLMNLQFHKSEYF